MCEYKYLDRLNRTLNRLYRHSSLVKICVTCSRTDVRIEPVIVWRIHSKQQIKVMYISTRCTVQRLNIVYACMPPGGKTEKSSGQLPIFYRSDFFEHKVRRLIHSKRSILNSDHVQKCSLDEIQHKTHLVKLHKCVVCSPEAADFHRPQQSPLVSRGSPAHEDMCGPSVILFSLPLHGTVSLAEAPLQQSGPSWGP